MRLGFSSLFAVGSEGYNKVESFVFWVFPPPPFEMNFYFVFLDYKPTIYFFN